MAYILKGRELPKGTGDDAIAPCIFCGTSIRHVNGGGTGCYLSAVVDGKAQYFVYCNDPPCPQIQADYKHEKSIWRCGCETDYVENVGETCAACGRARRDAVPVGVETLLNRYETRVYVPIQYLIDVVAEGRTPAAARREALRVVRELLAAGDTRRFAIAVHPENVDHASVDVLREVPRAEVTHTIYAFDWVVQAPRGEAKVEWTRAYATHSQAASARAQHDKCIPIRVGDDQDREYTTEVQGLPASDAAYQAIRRAAQIGEGRRVRVVRGVAVGVYP